MTVKLEWRGLDRFLARVRAEPERLARALAGALYEEAEELMTAAKLLTPVDTGALRASGHVQLPVREGSEVSVTLGFGGPAGSGQGQAKNVGYAVHVHEDLGARHVVGQAKYLEQPFNERKVGMARRLVERINRRLGR